MISLQYYQRPFLNFYLEISDKIHLESFYLRKDFWNLIPPGEYSSLKAQSLFRSYSNSLEKKADKIINKYSIAYWLHLSRRIGVGSGGSSKNPITISINRFKLLALIQKYGKKSQCNHINNSKAIDISKVFNGLLLSDEFKIERKIIKEHPAQLVLTDFTFNNLLEYYDLENICYELWVCGAKMRSIAKGAVINVDQNSKEVFYEKQDDALDFLISSYDSRLSGGLATETGTVYSNEKFDHSTGIFIPILNTNGIPGNLLSPLTEKYLNVSLPNDPTNFVIFPYPFKKFIEAHKPFEKDFNEKYNVGYIEIVILIASLCLRYFYMTAVEKKPNLLNLLMRGYEGPSKKKGILEEIKYFLPMTCEILKQEEPKDYSINKAFNFLELKNQKEIVINNFGTLKLFCPFGSSLYFVDLSIIASLLNSLFDDIDLNAYNFRGELLENAIGFESYLPTKPLKAQDGSSKQIDFSYIFDDVLIIAECKVVARRHAYFTGSTKSLELRQKKVIEKGLKEVDEKAEWLIRRTKGKNYNLNKVNFILPLVISPFVEFIDSANKKYWINEELPRILSLDEFNRFISEFRNTKIKFNLKKADNNGEHAGPL